MERQRLPGRAVRLVALVISTLATLFGLAPGRANAFADDSSIPLTAATERGAYTVGAARGDVSTVSDPVAGHDVLKFDYVLPPGTGAGVWSKAFPAGLSVGTIDLVRLAVKSTEPDQSQTIAVTI